MKRTLLGCLVGTLLSLGLATPSTAAGPYKIGYDIYFTGNSWSVQLYQEFKAAAEKNAGKVEVTYVESELKTDKQIANIEDLVTKGVDAIVTTPTSPTALIPVLKKARAKGIKVVLLASTIRSKDYDALVTVDDGEFGRVGAEWLVKALGGKGDIVVLNGIAGISASDDRWKGAKAVFDANPGIKVLSVVNASWDYAQAKVAVSNLLPVNAKVDGVWSQGGAMTLGAIDAFQAAQRPLVPMTGEDNNGYLKRWKALREQGFKSVAPSKPTWLGAEAFEVTLGLLEGRAEPKDDVFPPPVITEETLNGAVKPSLSDSFWSNTRLSDAQVRAIFKD